MRLSPHLCFRRLAVGAVALAALSVPRPGRSQEPLRPYLDWRTIETPHFAFHFAPGLEAWTRAVAERIESVRAAEVRLVGFAPPDDRRIQVVVDDPYNEANGWALPFIDRPVMTLWATPPSPRDDIGDSRSWGEMLATHELAHIVHLVRPSRNPATRLLWRLLPVDVGPMVLETPRWLFEGYATYVEGRLTGSGRPNNAWRAAMLRQWAIEGKLPTYEQLSEWRAFSGEDFAYLGGSAYLEWLAARAGRGDSTLVAVWRRLTARTVRSFDEAFAGVYGDSPRDLYGRFAAELTGKALAAERELDAAGIVAGEMVQRLAWATGDPAISPDGARVAIVVRSTVLPSRVVIWSTSPEPDTADARARAELLRRDPEDVPARRAYPRPKRALATLLAKNGRSYEDPRFLPDGRHILVWRRTTRPDGTIRPDLYIWDSGRGSVRRVTRGAAVREGDPWPDGRSAAAVRCTGGHCDLVRVDLANGAVTALAEGTPARSFYRPRVSADGGAVAVSVQEGNRWRIALVDARTSSIRFVDPDEERSTNRFDAAFVSPDTLVLVSERSGIANLELLDIATGATSTITRVSGAAVAPEPNRADRSTWFLSLHSKGYDLWRLPPQAPRADRTLSFDSTLVPAVRRQADPAALFVRETLAPSRGYGLGPRVTRWLPIPTAGPDGASLTLALANSDVVERLDLLVAGSAGTRAMWEGGAVSAAWRGLPNRIEASLFDVRQTPARQVPFVGGDPLDVRLSGGFVAVARNELHDGWRFDYRIGGSAASLRSPAADAAVERLLAFARLGAGAQQTGDGWRVAEALSASRTTGATSGVRYDRNLLAADLAVAGVGPVPLELSVTHGRLFGPAPAFERFAVGGMPSPVLDDALLPQRFAVAALPTATAVGERLLAAHLAAPIGLLTPFFFAASVHGSAGRFDEWHRAIGIQATFEAPPIPAAGTPGARAAAGVARSFDPPLTGAVRAYVSIALWP